LMERRNLGIPSIRIPKTLILRRKLGFLIQKAQKFSIKNKYRRCSEVSRFWPQKIFPLCRPNGDEGMETQDKPLNKYGVR